MAQDENFVLRRDQILRFVLSRPANRFRSIASILGIEDLDEIELEMKGMCNDLEGEISSKKEQKSEILQDISDDLGEEVVKTEDILRLLNGKLKEAKMPQLSSLEEDDEHSKRILKKLRSSKNLEKCLDLKKIPKKAESPFFSSEARKSMQSLQENVQSVLEDQDKVRKLSRIKLLKEGKKVIEETRQDVCPLCNQEIDREKLYNDIQKRLGILSALSEEAEKVRKNAVKIEETLKSEKEKLESLITTLESISELREERNKLSKEKKSLGNLIEEIRLVKGLKKEVPIQKFEEIGTEFDALLYSLSGKGKVLLKEIGLTEEEDKALGFIQLTSTIENETRKLTKLRREIEEKQRLYTRAEKLYSAFKQAKNDKLRDLYRSIEGDVNRFYSTLHPDDPHENIELVPVRRASTELRMESFGQSGEHPKAFASEGHLDSLGLCIFLAFVKKFNQDCDLVVLDDVVATIDAQHRKKICDLIFDESSEKQLFITTQDEIWFEQLQAYQRSHRAGGDFVNKEIIHWDVQRGPIFRKYKPRWKEIRDKLDAGGKEDAGSEGRTYLEWLLKEICERTETKISYRRDGKYVVGDLFRPAWNRLEEKIGDEDYRKEVSQAFKKIEETKFMANLLPHDNPKASKLSIEEVRGFCEAVRELHEILSCFGRAIPHCFRHLGAEVEHHGFVFGAREVLVPSFLR